MLGPDCSTWNVFDHSVSFEFYEFLFAFCVPLVYRPGCWGRGADLAVWCEDTPYPARVVKHDLADSCTKACTAHAIVRRGRFEFELKLLGHVLLFGCQEYGAHCVGIGLRPLGTESPPNVGASGSYQKPAEPASFPAL